MGSLRGEAPHKLQVGGEGEALPPPNAPKALEGVQSSLGEVVTVNMSQMPTENMFQKGPKS